MLGNRLEQGRQVARRHNRRLCQQSGAPKWLENWTRYIHKGEEITRDEWERIQLGVYRKTRCFCSTCCGNPRSFYKNSRQGMTLQERRQTQRAKY